MSDADIQRYLGMIQAQGQQGLQQAFGAAQQNIGAQFTPAMRMAQARLAANPLLGDSGYANRLNREIQTSAFGDLSNAYSNAAAQQAQGETSALQNLINQRLAGRQNLFSQIYATGQPKKNTGDYLGQLAGAGLGTAASLGWSPLK